MWASSSVAENESVKQQDELPVRMFWVVGTGGVVFGSYMIGSVITEKLAENEGRKQQRNRFTLGCALIAIGLNVLSYVVFPSSERNQVVRIDAIRRTGLWAIFGTMFGYGTGHLMFIT